VGWCLEWKHLKIRLAFAIALLTIVQICCDIVSLLSVKMRKSRITGTGLTLACLISLDWSMGISFQLCPLWLMTIVVFFIFMNLYWCLQFTLVTFSIVQFVVFREMQSYLQCTQWLSSVAFAQWHAVKTSTFSSVTLPNTHTFHKQHGLGHVKLEYSEQPMSLFTKCMMVGPHL